jgi:hypothetical protein
MQDVYLFINRALSYRLSRALMLRIFDIIFMNANIFPALRSQIFFLNENLVENRWEKFEFCSDKNQRLDTDSILEAQI